MVEPRDGFDPEEVASGKDGASAPDDWGLSPINWGSFWDKDSDLADWAMEPILPAGRCTAIYAGAKIGKSLLALDMAAASATGRSSLGQVAQDPVTVLYVDLEMTDADLRERLSDLGYGPDDDLSRLVYLQLPTLPGLDSDLGGELLVELAQRHAVTVVVIDTMARAVAGEENSADTYRNFYRYTGRRLKQAGIAVLRLDHQGKDAAQGQRGSSAKDDDLDVVFKLTSDGGNNLLLTRTRSRIPWVPAEVTIKRHEEPLLRHVISADAWPAGTSDTAIVLGDLAVPLDATVDTAMRALRSAGNGKRKTVVLAALKYRRSGQ
jgi:AAA domain